MALANDASYGSGGCGGGATPLVTLDARGPRGALSVARARELAAPGLPGGPLAGAVRRLVLSTWAHSAESAAVFAEVIDANAGALESAVLADIIAGRPEAEGLAVYRALGGALARVAALRELDVSDNAMGLKGVDALRGALERQAALERLFVCNTGLSAEAARALADALLFRAPTRLRTLHFDNNMSGGGGAVAVADVVAASPELANFRFSSSRGTKEGGAALAAALAAAPGLAAVNLHDNLFGPDLGAGLRTTLPRLRALRVLDVGDTLLRGAGLAALAGGLARCPAARATLQILDVSANELGARAAPVLARLLRACTALVELRAEDNEGLGDDGAAVLAARGLAARAPARAARSSAVARSCAAGRAGGSGGTKAPVSATTWFSAADTSSTCAAAGARRGSGAGTPRPRPSTPRSAAAAPPHAYRRPSPPTA